MALIMIGTTREEEKLRIGFVARRKIEQGDELFF